MPFAELLQWIGDSRRSGTLQVSLELEECYFGFEAGRIVGYGSDDPMARDLGRMCLRAGLVDEEGLRRALEAQAQSQMLLGDVFEAEGLVAAAALQAAVRTQVQETILGLFLWPEGRFNFSDAPSEEAATWMPPEYVLEDPIESRGILMEGMRRIDEWKRIVRVLPSDDVRLRALTDASDLPIVAEIAAQPLPPTLGELFGWKGEARFQVYEQLFRAVERGALAIEAPSADDPRQDRRGSSTPIHLCHAAEVLISEGQHDEAAALLRSAIQLDPWRADVHRLLERLRRQQLETLYGELVEQRIVERTAAPATQALSPRERKVLEQVNGRWDVRAIASTSALGEMETLRVLKRLVQLGLIRLRTLA